MSHTFGYDYEDSVTGELKFFATGTDRDEARKGAERESKKHGSAAWLVFPPGGGEAIGATTYVDGRFSSRDGVTKVP